MTTHPPMPATADVQRLLAGELARASKPGHIALLLAGLTGAGLSAALLLTETALPTRTRLAFLALTAIGLAWSAFAAWVLARRGTLLGAQRIVAGRMAVAFTTLFTIGTLALGGWAATVVGVALMIAAVMLLMRARSQVAALARRRAELERELAVRGPAT